VWGDNTARFHSGAWLLWLLAAMLGALLTHNPYYLALVIAVALWVNTTLSRSAGATGDSVAGHTPAGLIRLVVVFTVFVALFKGLWSNNGQTVLWRLPDWWPDIGRVVTLEGLVSAGLDAMQILAVLATFAAFSAGADYYAILRATPQSMRQVGLITSIALTFVPQTVTRYTEVREAQALRGHRIRRVGDLVPLVVPLLGGGIERSIDLAEAMESRGFSHDPRKGRRVPPILVQLGIATGLALVLAGGTLFAFWPTDLHWSNWVLIFAGVLLIGATLWMVGRGVKRTRYRHTVWRERDSLLTVFSFGIISILATYKWLAPAALVYNPYPRIAAPPFDPVLAITLIALASPAIILLLGVRSQESVIIKC
jgi:energy-coupling factor transport system permease protein